MQEHPNGLLSGKRTRGVFGFVGSDGAAWQGEEGMTVVNGTGIV
jgi:hypothetical protein